MCSLPQASDGTCNYCRRRGVPNGVLYCSWLCATQDSKRSSYASRSPASLAKSVPRTRGAFSLIGSQSAPSKSDGLKVYGQSPLHVLGGYGQSGKWCNDDEETGSVSRPANFTIDLHVNLSSSTQPRHIMVLSNPLKTEQSQCATVRSKEVYSGTKVEINKHLIHGSESPLAGNQVSIKTSMYRMYRYKSCLTWS